MMGGFKGSAQLTVAPCRWRAAFEAALVEAALAGSLRQAPMAA